MKKLLVILNLILFYSLYAQRPVPAPKQSKSVLIIHGTIHIGNGEVINDGLLGFKDGIINEISKYNPDIVNKYDTIINATNKHIYPGFIAANSGLGLVEIDAVRATRDIAEVGQINPNLRSIIAYNTDSRIIPTVRTNGILLAQITPRSGLISGTSSIVQLDAWNWEDAIIKIDDGIHLNWPNSFIISGWWASNIKIKENKNKDKEIEKLYKFFSDAYAYSKEKIHKEKNLRFEAVKALFNGDKKLFIHVNYVKDIIASVNFAKEFGIKNIVIVGGHDSWKITDFLKKNNVAVLLERTHSLPKTEDEDIDISYKLPSLLSKEGILFGLQGEGDMEQINTRNLPFYAGTAVAYGLDKEKAVESITLNVAKILGIDNKYGSLEKGKNATLFISQGDALEIKTNKVEMAFIDGRKINLSNHQYILYKEYSKKYGFQN